MTKLKIWLILFGIGLIIMDKFSFVNSVRDSVIIFLQKQSALLIYRIENYPRLIMLQTNQQHELARQNIYLKKQVEEYSLLLKQSKNRVQDIRAINELSPAKTYDNYTANVVRAILDVNFFVNNQLLIDQGSDKNIKPGLAVVNRDGIIGQISTVNLHNSQVKLITNPDFKIYVEESATKSKMLAQGAGNNTIIVHFIDKNDKIKVGDILETTGLDDVYPANIPVARIVKVFYENNGFNSAFCIPIVDFHKLQYILVLKNANQ